MRPQCVAGPGATARTAQSWAGLNVVSTAHRCVGELAYKLKPGTIGERSDGLALALIAALSAPTLAADEVRM
jgi:hypothetical protein